MWVLFAFLSAIFAGMTSILAKCGIKKTDSNVATFIRTLVVLPLSLLMALIVNPNFSLGAVSSKTLVFLVLSGLSTGIYSSFRTLHRSLLALLLQGTFERGYKQSGPHR